MDASRFDQPRWYLATTLVERLAASTRAPADRDGEAGSRRFEKWKAQSPFDRDGLLARRLEQDGLDEDGLRGLLGETEAAVRERFDAPPDWLRELCEAFLHCPDDLTLPFPRELLETGEGGFLWAAAPLIHQGRRRLRETLRRLRDTATAPAFDPDALEAALWSQLPPQLRWTLSRTMALELYVAGLEERLAGDTPAERFRSFVAGLRDPEALLELFEHYPALARQLTLRVGDWVDTTCELLERLGEDFPALAAAFSPRRGPGRLVEVRSGLGDRHRGGRTVHVLRFSSGWKLVYKPRPMAAAAHFQELLEWLNTRGLETPFRTLRVLDRGGYGWLEFVDGGPCESRGQVERFYRRQGGYLALLYALAANDFHYENLIAAGEHPVLIDLESLFQPRLGTPRSHDAQQLAYAEMDRSVLRVGLLPQRVWANDESEGIDLSGLGARDGQMGPDKAPVWEGVGTDEMRLTRKKLPLAVSGHRPALDGAEVEVADYAEAVVEGFVAAYRLLLDHRRELLAGDGPLAAFAGDEVRVIARPTRVYGLLLQESFHPDLMANGLDRDRHFDRLWLAAEHRGDLVPLIPTEREELHRGDIPLFTLRLGEGRILGRDQQIVGDPVEVDGLELARRRIEELSAADLEKQTWFVRASLATLAPHVERPAVSGPRAGGASETPERERYLAAARAAGDRLETLAFRGGGEATWIGMTSRMGGNWSLAPLGPELYSGLPGVALFLAYLGELSGEERYSELARAAVRSLERHFDAAAPSRIGAFDGDAGWVYVQAHLGRLWHEPARIDAACGLAARLADLIDSDARFDVVSGAAGCLAVLLGLHRASGDERLLAAAARCGERLAAAALTRESGVGWPPPANAGQPMGGFGHGAAGIAWALSELAAASGEERYRELARAGQTYENTLFAPEVGNWRDVRDLETLQLVEEIDGDLFMTAWCYGAPGIALGRLAMLRHTDDAETRRDAEIALATTLEAGFGGNHSLCHGDLGNLEALHLACETLDEETWRPRLERVATAILADVAERGFLSGMALGVETPGLMTGIAGIGYGLLRLAAPGRVPSVLLLEPPRATMLPR